MFVDPHLKKSLFGWHSPRLGMDMPIACYGDWGRPLLIFPTAQADYLENERFYLIKAIEQHIFDGKVRVFCVDSINRHAWMNSSISIVEAARRQALYASYIEDEVVPYIRDAVRNPSARVGVTGASFGAFHAANQFFRRPDLFDTLIAMSGFFDLDPDYTHGYRDDNVYFNNPVAYIANIHNPDTLNLIAHSQIHIVTGQGQWESPKSSVQLSEVLRRRGIDHNLDMWGYDVPHDWPSWRQMLDHYIGGRLGW